MKLRKGFTILEVALSIAMLGIIFAMTMPMYRVFTMRNDLDIATISLVQNLRRAQTLSSVGDGDSTWGVRVSAGSILLYKGANYASRDTSFDELTTIPSTIIVSGLSDVVFSKVTGFPQSTGTCNFTLSNDPNETRNITINQKGMVEY